MAKQMRRNFMPMAGAVMAPALPQQRQVVRRPAPRAEYAEQDFVEAPVRLRPQPREEAPVADFSPRQFREALAAAHETMGSWFNLACELKQRLPVNFRERKLIRWSHGDGPTTKTMAVVYPHLLALSQQQ